MLNYNKMSDIQHILKNSVSINTLIASVFEDCPDLKYFSFSCTNEYDDNNYSDYTRLIAVNGHRVDYDGEYEEDEVEEVSEEKKIEDKSVIESLVNLVHDIGTEFGHGDDLVCRREEYVLSRAGRKTKGQKAEMEYVSSYLTGGKLNDDWFLKNDLKFACYYAQDNGAFSKELEMILFCKEGRMFHAYLYAQAIKKPLRPEIENFFVTHNVVGTKKSKEDSEWLKKYLILKESFGKKKVSERVDS